MAIRMRITRSVSWRSGLVVVLFVGGEGGAFVVLGLFELGECDWAALQARNERVRLRTEVMITVR